MHLALLFLFQFLLLHVVLSLDLFELVLLLLLGLLLLLLVYMLLLEFLLFPHLLLFDSLAFLVLLLAQVLDLLLLLLLELRVHARIHVQRLGRGRLRLGRRLGRGWPVVVGVSAVRGRTT